MIRNRTYRTVAAIFSLGLLASAAAQTVAAHGEKLDRASAAQSSSHQTAAGHINVTSYKPQPYQTVDGFVFSTTDIAEDFSGDFSGAGSSRLILITESATGSVHFTGMERFTGSLGKNSGSFLFQNSGALENGKLHSTWSVIAGSGTGALTGIRGEGGCSTQGCHLDYWFQ